MEPLHCTSIFHQFQLPAGEVLSNVIPIHIGHINKTYLLEGNQGRYILQAIHPEIFTDPEGMMDIWLQMNTFLQENNYPKILVHPIQSIDSKYLVKDPIQISWRLMPFIEDTFVISKVQNANQAYIAARAVGEWHRYIQGFDAQDYSGSIPNFIHFGKRIEQWNIAVHQASSTRILNAQVEIELAQSYYKQFELFIHQWTSGTFPITLIHGDPKISNLLFNPALTDVKAMIDWDTLMPGSILYDYGDMVRSYTNMGEEDANLHQVFHPENWSAVRSGFLDEMKPYLSKFEIENLDTAAQCIIYVQAIRFLTDYLNGDIYFHIHYPDQNLNRTRNQLQLLKEFMHAC